MSVATDSSDLICIRHSFPAMGFKILVYGENCETLDTSYKV